MPATLGEPRCDATNVYRTALRRSAVGYNNTSKLNKYKMRLPSPVVLRQFRNIYHRKTTSDSSWPHSLVQTACHSTNPQSLRHVSARAPNGKAIPLPAQYIVSNLTCALLDCGQGLLADRDSRPVCVHPWRKRRWRWRRRCLWLRRWSNRHYCILHLLDRRLRNTLDVLYRLCLFLWGFLRTRFGSRRLCHSRFTAGRCF